MSPAHARIAADTASEAIRALNHATQPADGFPGLSSTVDAYRLLGALQELADRMPQLLEQISAYLQRQLQLGLVDVDDGPHIGDPLTAIGTASNALEGQAIVGATRLAAALELAHQTIAWTATTSGAKP
jgi:hypothetical protein